MTCFTTTAFAADDPIQVVNNLSDFIFGLVRAVGMIMLGFGVVQIGLSLKSHDPSQRGNGFLTLAGGVVITFAIGQAMTTMVGQNMGAGLTSRAENTGKVGLRFNLLVTLMAVIAVQVFSKQLIMLFDPSSPEVIEAGVQYLRICCFWNSLVYAIMYSFDSFAVGVGSANLAMINALLDAVVIRLPLCWLLSTSLLNGFEGIYWGQALSPIIPAILGGVYFYSKRWKKKRLIESTI